jgi:hypothetical protein
MKRSVAMGSNTRGLPQGKYDPTQYTAQPLEQYDNTNQYNIPPPPIFKLLPDTPRPKRNLLVVLLSIIGLLVAIAVQLARPLLLESDLSQSTITPVANPTKIFITTATATAATKHSGGQTKTTPVIAPAQPLLSSLSHFIGGFSIESNAEIVNAVDAGIQSTLIYGYALSEIDQVSATLKANNIKVIDAMPWEYLYYYECHIHNTCSATIYPELTSPGALLSDVTAHLMQVQSNSLVIGYWVLDDWPYKSGSGKDLLIQINSLIHQYTPGKPSICGFGGEIPPLPQTIFQWDDSTAANFSPQGCDMVGLYIYGQSYTTGSYDWTMSHILPAVFTSLKNRGWNITKEPLVGISQAFGGTVYGETWPVPDANSVETQTKTYCQQGATGIIYYNWVESGPSPMTDSQITQGIKKGNADCKEIWK